MLKKENGRKMMEYLIEIYKKTSSKSLRKYANTEIEIYK